MRPRTRSFALGTTIVAVALVLVPLGIYRATDGEWVLAIRGAVLVVLLALGAFVVALGRSSSRRVAGQPCVLCSRTILREHEGDFCDLCKGPAHGTCLGEHRANAHDPAKAPFR